jgi:heme exporter protein C
MNLVRQQWWKWLAVSLVVYSVIGGLLFAVPALPILNETIRAVYFHVPMWFGMIALFTASTIYAIRYLRNPTPERDIASCELAHTGLALGLLGIFTGMIWANYTWGSPWHGDPKQNGAAIACLIYLAYFVLRGSVANAEQKARLSAAYNIFAFVAMIPLIFILPRMMSSMHPGADGNPAFNMYDLDSTMRPVFYPACVGWILIGAWIASLRIRTKLLEERIHPS